MGTLATLTPLLGLLCGIILARIAKSELKDGHHYFILSQHVLLAGILTAVLWHYAPLPAIGVGALVWLALWKTEFSHPLQLMPLLFVPAVVQPVSVFLYFIPTGTLMRKQNLLPYVFVYAVLAIIATI